MSAIDCPCCGAPIPESDARVLFDVDAGVVVANGHVAALPAGEFALFLALWGARPRALSKDKLLKASSRDVTGDDERDVKVVDVLVHHIRKKLGPLGIRIETLWGQGYRIVPTSQGGTHA